MTGRAGVGLLALALALAALLCGASAANSSCPADAGPMNCKACREASGPTWWTNVSWRALTPRRAAPRGCLFAPLSVHRADNCRRRCRGSRGQTSPARRRRPTSAATGCFTPATPPTCSGVAWETYVRAAPPLLCARMSVVL
jgi:hypothetical protein